jgi:hypothetical protein
MENNNSNNESDKIKQLCDQVAIRKAALAAAKQIKEADKKAKADERAEKKAQRIKKQDDFAKEQGVFTVVPLDENLEEETVNTGVVYKLTCITTGKCYIGKTLSYTKFGFPRTKTGAIARCNNHFFNAHGVRLTSRNRTECPFLYEAMREHPQKNWTVEILKVCKIEDLKKWETDLTKQYKSYLRQYGYNYFIGDNKPQYT